MKKLIRISVAAFLTVALFSFGELILPNSETEVKAMHTPGGGAVPYSQRMVEELGLFDGYTGPP